MPDEVIPDPAQYSGGAYALPLLAFGITFSFHTM
jgi:hypothetical protein